MSKLPLKLDPDFHSLHRSAFVNDQRRKLLAATFQQQERRRVQIEAAAALALTAFAVCLVAFRLVFP